MYTLSPSMEVHVLDLLEETFRRNTGMIGWFHFHSSWTGSSFSSTNSDEVEQDGLRQQMRRSGFVSLELGHDMSLRTAPDPFQLYLAEMVAFKLPLMLHPHQPMQTPTANRRKGGVVSVIVGGCWGTLQS